LGSPGVGTFKPDEATTRGQGVDVTDSYRKDPETISQLSARQFEVTQESATEPPFDNEFWDHKEAGIYVDVVSGEPLFASTKKFDSGCGWPSFTAPLEPANVIEKQDMAHGMIRTEIRSSHGDSHLGHVFTDGPRAEGGLRYCINSAALRFVPYAELEAQGYGAYKKLFEGAVTKEEVAR
jgi:peptide-methionine (R)-S-oxide reductase